MKYAWVKSVEKDPQQWNSFELTTPICQSLKCLFISENLVFCCYRQFLLRVWQSHPGFVDKSAFRRIPGHDGLHSEVETFDTEQDHRAWPVVGLKGQGIFRMVPDGVSGQLMPLKTKRRDILWPAYELSGKTENHGPNSTHEVLRRKTMVLLVPMGWKKKNLVQ